jgi:hypothetical protein
LSSPIAEFLHQLWSTFFGGKVNESLPTLSLRSGFVTEAGRQLVPLADTMAMTGHQSAATVMGYLRASASVRSAAANLLP